MEGKEIRGGESPRNTGQHFRNIALLPPRRKHSFVARTMTEPQAWGYTQREILLLRKSVQKGEHKCLSRTGQRK